MIGKVEDTSKQSAKNVVHLNEILRINLKREIHH